MKFNKLPYTLALLAGLTSLSTSCKKLLDVEPKLIKTSKQAFSNDRSADSVVVGMYFKLASSYAYSQEIPLSTGFSSDELKPGKESFNLLYTDMYKNNINPGDAVTNSFWTESYNLIFISNSIIEGVAASSGMSDAGKLKCAAEARFIRAFAYFYLVNFFGDVPLVTSTDYKKSAEFPRESSILVYQQILEDLLMAEASLTDNYPTEGRVRANKWVAKAMLARVYLYLKDWEKAELKSSEIIANTQKYRLGEMQGTNSSNAVMNIFYANSEEAIFQFWNNIGTSLGYNALTEYYNSYAVSDDPEYGLLNAFEPGDKRAFNYVRRATEAGGESRIYKYRLTDESPDYKEFTMVLRLAEQYLIQAEARAMLNQTGAAVEDLNKIRNRAGLSGLSTSMPREEVLTHIEKERRLELCFEWGDRWFNLKRLGHVDQVMNLVKPGLWTSIAALYPVPRTEILLNGKLKQNPGYN
ncbi:RagB/SusD family nutrient uptake outer membrane protein [Pedobacter sp. FW305-3-2-15-E-R2A2]|uniref:RagB/SusD family nutrient uptake outer membrane protein n=1 Tax=Pedobacter sp. FW305-3-2-15-E-R2A2 TaxID=3140251 RepID=UPI0031402C2B